MNQKTYRLHAFILKRKNYGEADKIITVFSRELGKAILIAKGIRKINSRRAGALELLNKVSMIVYKTKGMDSIAEVELVTNNFSLSQDYLKTHVAYQLIELIDKLSVEHQANEEIFELMEKAFTFLATTKLTKEKADKILARFQIRILEYLGFGVPTSDTYEVLKEYIENIIEKKLVAGQHLEL